MADRVKHCGINKGNKRIGAQPPIAPVRGGIFANNVFANESDDDNVFEEQILVEEQKRTFRKGGKTARKFSQMIGAQFEGNVEQYLVKQREELDESVKQQLEKEREKREEWRKLEQNVEKRLKTAANNNNSNVQDTGNYVRLNLRRRGPRKMRTRALRGPARLRQYRKEKSEIVREEEEEEVVEFEDGGVTESEDEEEKPAVKRRKLDTNVHTGSVCHNASIPMDHSETMMETADDATLMQLLKTHYKFHEFRPGQREAIQRVMNVRESCLLELPTGSGKALCYQLPALLLPPKGQLVLVVSPLLSLMADQLDNLPPALEGAMISTQQTAKQQDDVLDKVRRGEVRLLFVSPERLMSDRFVSRLQSHDFPHIALTCIDEAHCISEWSHNFRPAYLHLRDVIMTRLKCRTILALTATATRDTARSICNSLDIDFNRGIVRGSHTVRDNFCMSVSRSPDGAHKIRTLLFLLRSDRFKNLQSIIIYTSSRRDAETLAGVLKNHEFDAERYHAGLDARERSRIQRRFHDNKLRILCSTVAFGMGINKPDIECIIHYDMPRSVEHYVQEIGRAGRDGREAQTHMFLCDEDYLRLRSLCFSDYVDQAAMKLLLSMIFQPADPHTVALSAPFDVALSLSYTEQRADIRQPVIATVLSMLELHDKRYIQQLRKGSATYTVEFSSKLCISSLCQHNSYVAAIVKTCSGGRQMDKITTNRFTFDISAISRMTNTTIDTVDTHLSNMLSERKIIRIDRAHDAHIVRVLRVPDDITALTNVLTERMRRLESVSVIKLDTMYKLANDFARNKKQMLSREQRRFRDHMAQYFEGEEVPQPLAGNGLVSRLSELDKVEQKRLVSDVRSLLHNQEGMFRTPKACARCLYGIASPSTAGSSETSLIGSSLQYTLPQWARYRTVDFYDLVRQVTLEMIAIKTGAKQ